MLVKNSTHNQSLFFALIFLAFLAGKKPKEDLLQHLFLLINAKKGTCKYRSKLYFSKVFSNAENHAEYLTIRNDKC